MAKKNSSKKIIVLSVIGNGVITSAKFFCYLLTRSPSMMAEFLHSLGDTVNQLLILIGNVRGSIGPCKRFPLGHGRAQYLFNLLAAVGILLGAIYSIYHGGHDYFLITLKENLELIELSYWSLAVLLFSIAIEIPILLAAYRGVARRKGDKALLVYLKESDDPAIIGVLLEDMLAVFGSFMAFMAILLAYYFQNPKIDALCSILIGLMLMYMAVFLFKLNYRLIVGSALPAKEELLMVNFLEEMDEIDEIYQFQTEVLSPGRVRISFEAEFHGRRMIRPHEVKHAKAQIRKGQGSASIVNTSDRAIRNLGAFIEDVEMKLKEKFPQIVLVDIEPY